MSRPSRRTSWLGQRKRRSCRKKGDRWQRGQEAAHSERRGAVSAKASHVHRLYTRALAIRTMAA